MLRPAFLVLTIVGLAACWSPPPLWTDEEVIAEPGAAQQSAVTDYRRLEEEVLAELNLARTDPAGYADRLAALLPDFEGKLLHRHGRHYLVRTKEGAPAVREAIDALRRQKPVAGLTRNAWLARAALDHAADQGRTGALGHGGSDRSSPGTRINRYGAWTGSYGENIEYAAVVSGREVVEDLLIDDGVKDRGHRRNIFDRTAHLAGVGCGPHPRYGVVCVIDQTNGFVPRAGNRQN